MNIIDLKTSDQHQSLQELLPWYLNRTLAARERDTIERHLQVCPDCRQELAFLQAVAAYGRPPALPIMAGWPQAVLSPV